MKSSSPTPLTLTLLLTLGLGLVCGLFLSTPLVAQASATPSPRNQGPMMVRLGDISVVQGVRSNELTGIGIITGLKGTGDSAALTRQAMANLVRSFNLNIKAADLAVGALAMVTVRAVLPPFSKKGMKLDVEVSGIGDASSLLGGTLQPTILYGWDRQEYATAAGKVFVGGSSFGNQRANVTRNHPTAGRILNGADVKVAPKSFYLTEAGDLDLRFRNPSEHTVVSAVSAVNRELESTEFRAVPVDRYLIRIVLPKEKQTEEEAMRILDRIRDVAVPVQLNARVIIDETSGTIIAGEGIQISPCVVAVADLTISIVSEDEVSQPLPGINRGQTAIVNRTRVEVNTENTPPQALPGGGATVQELLANLKALKLPPHQLIEVFQKLKTAGFLQAELLTR